MHDPSEMPIKKQKRCGSSILIWRWRGLSTSSVPRDRPISLAVGADAEEFQLVGHGFESVADRDGVFELGGKAFIQFDNPRALRANQMMMVGMATGIHEFETGDAIAEVEALDHSHAAQQVHRPVDGCQVTIALGQAGEDLLDRGWMAVLTKKIEDSLPRSRDLSGF